MIVHLHDNLKKPLVVKATRLLVTFEDGTPCALITQIVPGHVQVFRPGDPEFAERLRVSGVEQTVIVDKLKPVTPREHPARLIY